MQRWLECSAQAEKQDALSTGQHLNGETFRSRFFKNETNSPLHLLVKLQSRRKLEPYVVHSYVASSIQLMS
jgi:hypothetical protein